MRVLIVNPNTSAGVTARIAEAAQGVALPNDKFTTVSAASGPELIVDESDTAQATEGVLAAIRTHVEPIDGIVLASFGDTGAEEVRRLRPDIPVVGIASAAFGAVRVLGCPFAIVTFADTVVPSLSRKAEDAGLAGSLIGVSAALQSDHGDPGTVQQRLQDDLARLCHGMVDQGASAIVLGGGPLAGLARRIGPEVQVPVIDGTQAAIGVLRAASDRKLGRAERHPSETEHRRAEPVSGMGTGNS